MIPLPPLQTQINPFFLCVSAPFARDNLPLHNSVSAHPPRHLPYLFGGTWNMMFVIRDAHHARPLVMRDNEHQRPAVGERGQDVAV